MAEEKKTFTYDELRLAMLKKYGVEGTLAQYAFRVAWDDHAKEGAVAIEARFRQLMPLFYPAITGDPGHDALMKDLYELYQEAWHEQFHDFKNDKYAAPKVTLVKKLDELVVKVMHGEYDNNPDAKTA